MRQAHQRWWSRYRGGFGLRETAPLLLHLLGLLGDFLGRLGRLLCMAEEKWHGAEVSGFAVNLGGLRPPHRMRAGGMEDRQRTAKRASPERVCVPSALHGSTRQRALGERIVRDQPEDFVAAEAE